MTDRTGEPSNNGSRRDPATIDITVAHTSRIYDYLLGGTDHFEIDRKVAHHAFETYPGGFYGARADARANRAFLGRTVRFLAGDAGIRQFLDIGTGIPNADNTHAVAQQTDPAARIVYVDNDPIVLAHAHDMLTSTSEGETKYIHCDLREPDVVVKKASGTLDFSQPVAVVIIGVLHVIPDEDDPYSVVSRLMEAVVPGSYLAISHITTSLEPGEMREVIRRLEEAMSSTNPPAFRTLNEIERFFEGLELVAPGLVPVNRWRPDDNMPSGQHPSRTAVYGGVARKP